MKHLFISLVSLFLGSVYAQSIEQSHIDANVPARADFEPFLRRDVSSYFSKRFDQKMTIDYVLLRDGPTQSGIAYPKFYIWVSSANEDKKTLVEGAMRLAAVEKKRFDVTDFVSKEEIVAGSTKIEEAFPRVLIPKIKERAGVK